MAVLKDLSFDSNLFGRRIGMIDAIGEHGIPVAQLPFDKCDFVQAKVKSKDTQLIDELSASGFRICEGEIDFAFHVVGEQCKRPSTTSESTFTCRLAGSKDITTLCDLAARSFRGRTRFREPWFSNGEADLMYTTWITKAVRGEFDDVCLIVENAQGEAVGLVTLRRVESSDVRIGLLAVRDTARKGGVGGYLIDAAKEWTIKEHRSYLRAATQISNVDAMRLYTRTGAAPVGTAYWLYKT